MSHVEKYRQTVILGYSLMYGLDKGALTPYQDQADPDVGQDDDVWKTAVKRQGRLPDQVSGKSTATDEEGRNANQSDTFHYRPNIGVRHARISQRSRKRRRTDNTKGVTTTRTRRDTAMNAQAEISTGKDALHECLNGEEDLYSVTPPRAARPCRQEQITCNDQDDEEPLPAGPESHVSGNLFLKQETAMMQEPTPLDERTRNQNVARNANFSSLTKKVPVIDLTIDDGENANVEPELGSQARVHMTGVSGSGNKQHDHIYRKRKAEIERDAKRKQIEADMEFELELEEIESNQRAANSRR